MSTILTPKQRRLLDTTVQQARVAAEVGAADSLRALAVADTHRPSYLDNQQNELRLALRAKAKQLGDSISARDADLTLLVRDVAYEQWHRLLFARFLERNGLLMHADFPDTPLSQQDCEDLATSGEVDEPDGWSVAARFAAQLLPGVFRLDDPAVRVRLSTEHRLKLEQLLMSIPAEVFDAEDALGWVYQFWQTAEKKRVNKAGDKIGGADLSPVTQLFTENYMVRFLLENSLGAWWAGRHPDSPLVGEWEYLRRLDDGSPAAGTFPEWPTHAADVTVMDPCCGSGHFLVAMFGMLWRMRAEEEGLSASEAQDAVLRDNLFGLELDPRCTQIATFNVALEAWKQGGNREIPTPQIACSGVPVRQSRDEWLEGVPDHLRYAMVSLHTQFRHADALGSLVDPRPAESREEDGGMFGRDMQIGVTWEELQPYLAERFAVEGAAGSVLGNATEDVVHAAALLTRTFTLVATNVPFLGKGQTHADSLALEPYRRAACAEDLATVMLERAARLAGTGTCATVSPVYWLQLVSYEPFRHWMLHSHKPAIIAPLGPNAFREIKGEVVQPVLSITNGASQGDIQFLTVGKQKSVEEYQKMLREALITTKSVASVEAAPNSRFSSADLSGRLLGEYVRPLQGIKTGDNEEWIRYHWELGSTHEPWLRMLSSPDRSSAFSGRAHYIRDGSRAHSPRSWARIQGLEAWGKAGVVVSSVGRLTAGLYNGEAFDSAPVVLIPRNGYLPSVFAFASSGELEAAIRQIDSKAAVTTATFGKIGFDEERWSAVAEQMGPLPEPHSDDPTQWLFLGGVPSSKQPLQVAVARLLGYRWPDQEPDHLDRFTDTDGIVALPNLGEGDAASRLRELLAAAYGDRWSGALEHSLVTEAGEKSGRLEDWLRDTFFAHHCKVFDDRPFLWHVWDGRKDGFSAILHYHRLDRPTLEKLTYTTLGAWIRRQKDDMEAGVAGAEARLAAAEDLQHTLELIIEGEAPHDIYVRWKPPHEQPIGWEPDLDDGVRLNIRPFVTAGILRSKVNVHWRKDRGKNPDGSERHNDRHPTLAERREARAQHEVGDG